MADATRARSARSPARPRRGARLRQPVGGRGADRGARPRRDDEAGFFEEAERRGIEITDDCGRVEVEDTRYDNDELDAATTDALQLFLNEAGRYPLLTAEEEVELAKRIERGDKRGQGADDQLQPAPRRLDRQALPGPRAVAARPDPGGDHRPDPRGREVRLAQGLQVLDVRDLVDPPGGAARRREQGAHDPDAGAHRRARAEDRARRARARREARPPADRRGDRQGGEAAAQAAARGPRRGPRGHEPGPADRRGRSARVRRLRRGARSTSPTASVASTCARRRCAARSASCPSASRR